MIADSQAFVFTLKNPHNVEPTQYMDSKDYEQSIYCDFDDGPVFGNHYGSAIHISFQCTKEKGCWIDFDKKKLCKDFITFFFLHWSIHDDVWLERKYIIYSNFALE